ncbi:MAG: hypothetical protein AAGF28_11815 [Pseudomonadota bacterium]
MGTETTISIETAIAAKTAAIVKSPVATEAATVVKAAIASETTVAFKSAIASKTTIGVTDFPDNDNNAFRRWIGDILAACSGSFQLDGFSSACVSEQRESNQSGKNNGRFG